MIDQAPPTVPSPPDRASRFFFGHEGLRPGWGILLFIILVAAFGAATNFLAAQLQTPSPPHTTSPTQTSPAHLFLSEAASLLAVLLATYTLSRIERRPFPTYGLGGIYKLSHFLQGLISGALCLSLLVAALRLTGYLHFDALLLHGTVALKYALLWTVGFTLVAFLEETLLRGYLQSTLTRGLNSLYGATPHRHAYAFWTAALLLSFLFGLSHTTNPGESPIGLLAAGCAGLVFCLSLYRTGSIWWALGAHASWDWAQSFLYGVADSGITVQHHLFATHPIGPPLLSGGLTGPEGSLFVLPTLALLAAIILLTLLPAGPGITAPQSPHTGSPSDPSPAPASAAYRR